MNPVYRSHVMTYGTYPDSWYSKGGVSAADTKPKARRWECHPAIPIRALQK